MMRDSLAFPILPRTPATLLAGVLAWSAPAAAQPPDAQGARTHEHVEVAAAALTPTREASGTAWLPDATPMYGLHRPWRGWDVRVDGLAFVQALFEPTDRHRTGGAARRHVSSSNWAMVLMRRPAGDGRFGVRAMVSGEPWTLGRCGALNLLATGEVCDHDTIHDR
jgi:hypothetical protein